MVKDALSQITKGASIIFIGTIFASLIGLFNQIFLGRILGPSDYGIFNLSIAIMSILCILPNFGLGQGLIQYIPYNAQKENFGKIRKAIKFSLKFTSIVGIIVSIFLFIFADFIALNIFNNIELSYALKLLSIALTFYALYNYTLGFIIQAFKAPKYYVYITNLLMPITQLSIFILLSLLGYKLFGAIMGFVLASIVASLSYIYIIHSKFYKPIKNSYNVTESTKKNVVINELIKLSFPLFLTGFTLLFMQYPDKLILGIFTNSFDVGLYTAAITIATLLLFIYLAFSFNSKPIISEYYAKNDFSSIKKLYYSTTKWIFFITFPLVIYIIFFSKDILTTIYGPLFVDASLPLNILALGIAIIGLTGLSGETLIATKKTNLNLYSELIGAISNITFNITLIPLFGLVGAAIGTSISMILRSLSSYLFVYKNFEIFPYDINFLKIIVGSIISLIIIYPFKNYLEPFSFVKVIPIFIISYLGFLIITKSFDESDRFIIESVLNKLFVRFKRGRI
ncbi:MAG: flippase [Methanobacterium sp.]